MNQTLMALRASQDQQEAEFGNWWRSRTPEQQAFFWDQIGNDLERDKLAVEQTGHAYDAIKSGLALFGLRQIILTERAR